MSRHLFPSPKFAVLSLVLAWTYWPTCLSLYDTWTTQPDYSHGLLVPLFALYLLAKGRETTTTPRPWPILGLGMLGMAILFRMVGSATSFLPLEGLSLVMALTALAMVSGGSAALRRFWMPLTFLLFMVPLPYEVSRMMGSELQRIATISSTFLMQCCGLPAIAEGNRILVEQVTLNVVEACSGLRMLVTFVAFSVAAVMLLERHWVVKVAVLMGAVPIALLTNILRITATGLGYVLLPEGDQKTQIMEFVHDFNGWMMMPVGLTFLAVELWFLKRLVIEKPSVPSAMPRPVSVAPSPTASRPRFVSVIQVPASN